MGGKIVILYSNKENMGKTVFKCLKILTEQRKAVVRHTVCDNVHQLHVQQPSTYEKPEAASAVLGS
jgi:hypothetical protein